MIKPYNDEMIKLLMKAREILDEANKKGIVLPFDVHIDNAKPVSYQDIIFNRNELSYIQSEVKDLEKRFQEEMTRHALKNIEQYQKNIVTTPSISYLVMKTENIDNYILKTIADDLITSMKPGIIFFANQKEDCSINYLCRSNSSIAAGLLMKKVATYSNGNGGGSPTFAQGGAKEVENLDAILEEIVQDVLHG